MSLKYLFGKLVTKLQRAWFRMKIRTKRYSQVLIAKSTIAFLSFVLKYFFWGQIWSRNLKVLWYFKVFKAVEFEFKNSFLNSVPEIPFYRIICSQKLIVWIFIPKKNFDVSGPNLSNKRHLRKILPKLKISNLEKPFVSS